jgi:hypothetical protein
MRRNWKHWAIIGLAVVAVVAGVTVAIVRSGGHGGGHGHEHAGVSSAGHSTRVVDSAVAANYLGLTKAQLRHELRTRGTPAAVADASSGKSSSGLVAALMAAKARRLQAEVASGALTSATARATLAAYHERAVAWVERLPRTVSGTVLTGAAGYLGVSEARIRSEQRAGHSLAQIAAARGKSSAGLTDAIVARRQAQLAAVVAKGSINARQEKVLLAHFRRRVVLEVNRRPPAPRPGARG